MTHYLNTVDEHYQSLVRERAQVITPKEIKNLKSKYWVAMSETNCNLDINLNFIYKESSELIQKMDSKRFPNINNLTLKRMERSKKELAQFLNNSWSYKVNNLIFNESKISTLDPSTWSDLVRMVKHNVQHSLAFEGIVITNSQMMDMLDAWVNVKELIFGAVLGVDGSDFLLKNKFRKLNILKILSPDWEDWIAFYTKLLNHLITNNTLKRLSEFHVETRHANELLANLHWQLFEDANYKKIITEDVIILKKNKADPRNT